MVPVSLTLSPRRPAPADRAALVEAVEGLTAEHAAVAHVYVGAPADGPVRVVLFLNLSAPAGQKAASGTSMSAVVGGLGHGPLGGQARQDLVGEELAAAILPV
jgi:hypothetical protein